MSHYINCSMDASDVLYIPFETISPRTSSYRTRDAQDYGNVRYLKQLPPPSARRRLVYRPQSSDWDTLDDYQYEDAPFGGYEYDDPRVRSRLDEQYSNYDVTSYTDPDVHRPIRREYQARGGNGRYLKSAPSRQDKVVYMPRLREQDNVYIPKDYGRQNDMMYSRDSVDMGIHEIRHRDYRSRAHKRDNTENVHRNTYRYAPPKRKPMYTIYHDNMVDNVHGHAQKDWERTGMSDTNEKGHVIKTFSYGGHGWYREKLHEGQETRGRGWGDNKEYDVGQRISEYYRTHGPNT